MLSTRINTITHFAQTNLKSALYFRICISFHTHPHTLQIVISLEHVWEWAKRICNAQQKLQPNNQSLLLSSLNITKFNMSKQHMHTTTTSSADNTFHTHTCSHIPLILYLDAHPRSSMLGVMKFSAKLGRVEQSYTNTFEHCIKDLVWQQPSCSRLYACVCVSMATWTFSRPTQSNLSRITFTSTTRLPWRWGRPQCTCFSSLTTVSTSLSCLVYLCVWLWFLLFKKIKKKLLSF